MDTFCIIYVDTSSYYCYCLSQLITNQTTRRDRVMSIDKYEFEGDNIVGADSVNEQGVIPFYVMGNSGVTLTKQDVIIKLNIFVSNAFVLLRIFSFSIISKVASAALTPRGFPQ